MSAFRDGINIGCRYDCLCRDMRVAKLCDLRRVIEFIFIYLIGME